MMRRRLFLILALTLCGTVASAQTDTLPGRVNRLDAAVIVSESAASRLLRAQTGLEAIDAGIIGKVPAFLGERDIIKVIQMLPGVQAPSEGSSGFSVRGGLIDQNLILFDGAPLYCAGHFLGFISMFNHDILNTTDLYKGDFPAKYGGRISSVLVTTSKDGDMEQFHGHASLGLLSSGIHLEGPLRKEKVSFCLSGRRSFLDAIFPFIKQVPAQSRLRFYDANAKLTWVATSRDRFYLSGFIGGDRFGSSLTQYGLNLMDFRYSNRTASLRWKHDFTPALQTNVTLYYSKYKFDLACDYKYAIFDYGSFVRETGLKADLTWQINADNTLEAGLQLPYFRIDSGDCVPRDGNLTISEIHIAPNFAVQPNLYVENRTRLGRAMLRYGLRISEYTSMGMTDQRYYDPVTHQQTAVRYFGFGEPIQTYWGLEPRLSASVALDGSSSVKASYTRVYQYFQQALVSTSGSPLDVWLPASPTVKPQISDQFSLGYYRNFLDNAVESSAELFYKNNKNTLDFVENTGVILDRPDREAFLRFGKSYAYGAELMVRYHFEKWNGWLGYTYSKAMYEIPEINEGKPYASPVNHDHSVNFLLSYAFSQRLAASAAWVFYSGAPMTFPVSRFALGDSYAPVFTARNEGRLPAYHRLDLSLTLKTRKRVENRRWSGEWNFSLYNAYSRHNVWSVAYSYSRYEDKPRAAKIYLFPILPSVSYNIQF